MQVMLNRHYIYRIYCHGSVLILITLNTKSQNEPYFRVIHQIVWHFSLDQRGLTDKCFHPYSYTNSMAKTKGQMRQLSCSTNCWHSLSIISFLHIPFLFQFFEQLRYTVVTSIILQSTVSGAKRLGSEPHIRELAAATTCASFLICLCVAGADLEKHFAKLV